MARFTDTITIRVKAGDGGPGAVSFHREKYVPNGGPDGGDGGDGGDIYIQADRRLHNLSHFFPNKLYKAEKGKQGMGSNMHGKDGIDLIIKVPPGTQVSDAETGDILIDLLDEDVSFCAAKGGQGGKGNAFFKSSTHQAPRFAQPGIEVEEFSVTLNLKLIADIGFVGLPNAGKSTLLARITNAKPKIGNYPFTTLIPNLGVLENSAGKLITLADIPGIIEGAHKGHGLGLSFLQHIERVQVLLYLIDCTEDDPQYTLELLQAELNTYNETLLSKPSYIVLTKTDLVDKEEVEEKMAKLNFENITTLSSETGEGMETLRQIIFTLMEEARAT